MDFFDRLRRQFGVPDAVRQGNRRFVVAAKVAQQVGVELPAGAEARARMIRAIVAVIDEVVTAAEDGRLDPQFAQYDAPDNVASDIASRAARDVAEELGVDNTRAVADGLIASLVKYVRSHPFEDDERK